MMWPEDSVLYKLMTLNSEQRPMPVDSLPRLTKEQWRTWAGREYSFQFRAARRIPFPTQDSELYGQPWQVNQLHRRLQGRGLRLMAAGLFVLATEHGWDDLSARWGHAYWKLRAGAEMDKKEVLEKAAERMRGWEAIERASLWSLATRATN